MKQIWVIRAHKEGKLTFEFAFSSKEDARRLLHKAAPAMQDHTWELDAIVEDDMAFAEYCIERLIEDTNKPETIYD
jgi:hypothetical protein